jgi:hypothetical protein
LVITPNTTLRAKPTSTFSFSITATASADLTGGEKDVVTEVFKNVKIAYADYYYNTNDEDEITDGIAIVNGTYVCDDDVSYEVELDASEKGKNLAFTDAPSNEMLDKFFDIPMSFYTFTESPKFNNVGTLTIAVADPDETDYYFYAIDAKGELSTISKAEYDEDEGAFTLKTRTLGAYVVSEEELDVDAFNTHMDTVNAATEETTTNPEANPSTGR